MSVDVLCVLSNGHDDDDERFRDTCLFHHSLRVGWRFIRGGRRRLQRRRGGRRRKQRKQPDQCSRSKERSGGDNACCRKRRSTHGSRRKSGHRRLRNSCGRTLLRGFPGLSILLGRLHAKYRHVGVQTTERLSEQSVFHGGLCSDLCLRRHSRKAIS